MDKVLEYGKLSEEAILELKKKHGDIYTLDVDYDENGKEAVLFGYLKKPDRPTLSMALSVIDRDPLRAKQILLEKSWLAGDERIKTDDDAFISASVVLDELIVVQRAGLKKN